MTPIILAGWREGLQKMALTNLQRELLHLSLKEAKENVDQLLEAEEGEMPLRPVVLQVPDEVAVEFSSRADALGVAVGLVEFYQARASRPPISAAETDNSGSQRSAA